MRHTLKTKLQSETENFIYNYFHYDRSRPSYDDYTTYREMLAKDDVVPLAYRSIILLAMTMMGDYFHDDKAVIKDVEDQFNSMQGSIASIFQRCYSFLGFGFAYAEIKHRVKNMQGLIDIIAFLEPENIVFEGTRHNIQRVKYYGSSKTVEMLYGKGFHLTNEDGLYPELSPYGFPLCERAKSAWEAHKILYASYIVTGQKQATKLLIGKTDTEADVIIEEIEDGEDITRKAGDIMLEGLQDAENNSVLVVNTNDEVEAVDQTTDGKFFEYAFYQGDKKRSRAFYAPQTLFSGNVSGVGDSGLADIQYENYLVFGEAIADYVGKEFIEQVLKPVLGFNLGDLPNYGTFPINKKNPKAIAIAQVLSTAIKDLTINDEDAAKDRLQELLGV